MATRRFLAPGKGTSRPDRPPGWGASRLSPALEAQKEERRRAKPKGAGSNPAQGTGSQRASVAQRSAHPSDTRKDGGSIPPARTVVVAHCRERRVVTPEEPVGFRSTTPLEVPMAERGLMIRGQVVRFHPSRPQVTGWAQAGLQNPAVRSSILRSPAVPEWLRWRSS